MPATAKPQDALDLRAEALLLLDGRGAILDTAREVSRAFAAANVRGAVIGGIAVLLHGHVRATTDIDVFIDGPLADAASVLDSIGFDHDPDRREFVRAGIPVHLVTAERLGAIPSSLTEIDGVITVSLLDLVSMKLRSGSTNLLRAQDLADVINLARRHGLTSAYAARLPKALRPAFRQITRALAAERDRP